MSPDQRGEEMDVIAIIVIIFVVGMFAALGASRGGALTAALWVVLGVFVWVVGYYVGLFVTEQLLGLAGTAIATNGIVVLSKLVGIALGTVFCYLFYRFVMSREQPITSARSTLDRPNIPSRTRG